MSLPDSRLTRARAAIAREDWPNAWLDVSSALNDDPDKPEALYLAGSILRNQGHVGMALAPLRRALAFEQKQPNLWMHYAACLHDVHKYDDAREAFLLVNKALPDDPMPIANIASGYVQQGKAKEAVEWAERALQIDPDNEIANVAIAYGNLALGRWEAGWKHSEYLYGRRITTRVYRQPEEPVWDGSKGKTVVVQADQGLGDIIMFAQCLPEMAKDCKQVILETSKRLAPLFRRNFPQIAVFDTIKEHSDVTWPEQYEIDARIHISWLPRYYRNKDSDFPRKAYLTACPEKREKWRKAFAHLPRPLIGLAWKGGIAQTNWKSRSMDLHHLAPILNAGGSFVSLAYQDIQGEIARWNIDNHTQVHVPGINNEGDYDEWLALIAEMDHVITVTTTVAHACGAMGKKAWVMVNQLPQWRYCVHMEDGGMIWYPENSVYLYRQKPGETDWQFCISRVAKDYATFILGN